MGVRYGRACCPPGCVYLVWIVSDVLWWLGFLCLGCVGVGWWGIVWCVSLGLFPVVFRVVGGVRSWWLECTPRAYVGGGGALGVGALFFVSGVGVLGWCVVGVFACGGGPSAGGFLSPVGVGGWPTSGGLVGGGVLPCRCGVWWHPPVGPVPGCVRLGGLVGPPRGGGVPLPRWGLEGSGVQHPRGLCWGVGWCAGEGGLR